MHTPLEKNTDRFNQNKNESHGRNEIQEIIANKETSNMCR